MILHRAPSFALSGMAEPETIDRISLKLPPLPQKKEKPTTCCGGRFSCVLASEKEFYQHELELEEIRSATAEARLDEEVREAAARNKRQQKAATGKAYRALKALIAEQCDDKDLQHCGLTKVKARDGTVEWVSYDSRVRFENEGAACLIWNANAPGALGSSRGSSVARFSSCSCESSMSS